MSRTLLFSREQLRTPFTLALIVVIPVLFVFAAAGALTDFAGALGGSLTDDAVVSLGAGWSAAFISGVLGFFQAVSSRGADRRLVLAGLGPTRVAGSRIGASIILACIAAAAGYGGLLLRSDIPHPLHAAAAVAAFALIYVAVGIVVGSLVTGLLEGSLIVIFVFLLDVFAGPGMSESAPPWAISQKAGGILIAAGLSTPSPSEDWLKLAVVTSVLLVAAFVTFVVSARSRV